MLVDLYFKIQMVSFREKERLIEAVSIFLNHRADILRIYKDKKFRNINGINMKLQNIEFIATDGEKGLSSVSALDREIFEFRTNYPQIFNEDFESIARKYGFPNLSR